MRLQLSFNANASRWRVGGADEDRRIATYLHIEAILISFPDSPDHRITADILYC